MRVLMLGRHDVHTVLGGDTVQMIQTKLELEKLGVQVQVGTVEQRLDPQEYDLIHIFNWEQLEEISTTYGDYLTRFPMVLSTIFWFHTGQWYDNAITRRWLWRVAHHVGGAARARSIYERWQQIKFRWGKRGRALRRLFQLPAQLLPNSYIEMRHLEEVLGLEGCLQKKCTIVPNGIQKELYDPLPPPNWEFQKEYGIKGFVLQVARIQSAKNQLGLIEALADLSIPIVFIGQPSPYEKEYVNRCYEQGRKRGNVYFLNPKTSRELASIYILAAVHVLPSWRETPGLASLEAAAAGCRIVSTANGSAREYFGDEAWYCDPRNPDSIRRAVLTALASPPSTKLRARVLEHFTWEAAAKATLEAYRQVIHSPDALSF